MGSEALQKSNEYLKKLRGIRVALDVGADLVFAC